MSFPPSSRRSFLLQAFRGSAALALGPSLAHCTSEETDTPPSTGSHAMAATSQLPVRRSWHALSKDERGVFQRGIELLTNETIGGKEFANAYQRLAYIHLHSCPHSNWYLLPWHRAFLAVFEVEMRRVLQHANVPGAASFAVPYWDWTNHPQIPEEFWDTTLDPVVLHKGFPSHAQKRWVPRELKLDTGKRGPVGPEALERVLSTVDFYNFASFPSHGLRGLDDRHGMGLLETLPHNYVHSLLGGVMMGNLSPLDPLFWLHHGNIDRWWNLWMARRHQEQEPLLPYTPTPEPTDGGASAGWSMTTVLLAANIEGSYAEYWLKTALPFRSSEPEDGVSSPDEPPFRALVSDMIDGRNVVLVRGEERLTMGCSYDSEESLVADGGVGSPSSTTGQPQPTGVASASLKGPRRQVRQARSGLVRQGLAPDSFLLAVPEDEWRPLEAFARTGASTTWTLHFDGLPVPDDAQLCHALEVLVEVPESPWESSGSVWTPLTKTSFVVHAPTGAHGGHGREGSCTTVPLAIDGTKVLDRWMRQGAGVFPVRVRYQCKEGLSSPLAWSSFRRTLPRLLAGDPHGDGPLSALRLSLLLAVE